MERSDRCKERSSRLPRAANCGKGNTLGKLMEDMDYLCRSILAPTFHLLHGHKTSLGGRIYGTPHFPDLSAFYLIREALWRRLSAFVDSHLPPAQNNLYINILLPFNFPFKLSSLRAELSRFYATKRAAITQTNVCWVNKQRPSSTLPINSYGTLHGESQVHTYYSTTEEGIPGEFLMSADSFVNSFFDGKDSC